MPNRKFGRASDQRAAILKNQVTTLIINGKLETTVARAKDISAIVEKLVASAIKEQDNYTTKEITVSAAKLDGKGKKVLKTKESKSGAKYEVVDREVKTKTVQVDNPSRLAARKAMIKWVNKSHDEDGNIINPVNKVFDEIAPKYASRNGGYTRIVKIGPRKGDAAMEVLIELV